MKDRESKIQMQNNEPYVVIERERERERERE